MHANPDGAIQDPFRSVRCRFERWRCVRVPGEPIPEALWRSAAGAAREQGISKTAVALGLNHAALKKHIASGDKAPSSGRGSPARFVAIPPLAFPAAPACVVAIEDGRGMRLKIELSAPAIVEVAPIVRSLWEARLPEARA